VFQPQRQPRQCIGLHHETRAGGFLLARAALAPGIVLHPVGVDEPADALVHRAAGIGADAPETVLAHVAPQPILRRERRIAGDDVDAAADALAVVEHRTRTTDDLDALDVPAVDLVDEAVGAERGRLDRMAVDQIVGVALAADRNTDVAGHGDAGHARQQLAQRIGGLDHFQFLARDHRTGHRRRLGQATWLGTRLLVIDGRGLDGHGVEVLRRHVGSHCDGRATDTGARQQQAQ
jgi:hypothetical protein